MLQFRRITPLIAAVAVLACSLGFAEDQVDPSTLYEVSTEGTTTRVKAGDKGVFVLSIKSRSGAHVSDEAPLKLELKGAQLTPAKERLALADSVAKKAEGQQFVDPRFEVPFQASAPGKGTLDAKLTFFICTETLCARQQKTFSIPVEVQ